VNAAATAGAAATVGTVAVNGGKTVTVTETLTASTADVTKAVTGGSINVTGNATTTTVSVKQTASAAATASVGAINTGVVTIADGAAVTAANTIGTVTVDGYKTGSKVTSNALSNLTLANPDAGAAFTVVANTAAAAAAPTTLKLTVNNAAGSLDLENGATAANKVYKTLNVTTAGKDSALNVTGTIVETLTVAGTNGVDLTGSTLTALKNCCCIGAAGVTGDFSGANVTSVDASASSGKNTVSVDATKAVYKGGSGVDIVT
jgi:S-layer protein